MRKKILFALWLLVPVVVLAYHFGPGQARLGAERAAQSILQARALEAAEQWPEAVQAWADALAATPADKVTERFQLRLAHDNARIYAGELPEAMDDMEKLLAEAQFARQRELLRGVADAVGRRAHGRVAGAG